MTKPSIRYFDGDYRFLSNFYEQPVVYNGLLFLNSEAAYQSQKCADPNQIHKFCNLNAGLSKKAGRNVTLRSDWDTHRFIAMMGVLESKFSDPGLKEKLLATGDAHLEEGNTWGDRTWGTVDGEGSNYLGEMLMALRAVHAKEKGCGCE